MTVRVGVRDVRENLRSLLELVKEGEEIVVTERAKAVARLTPLDSGRRKLDELVAASLVVSAADVLVASIGDAEARSALAPAARPGRLTGLRLRLARVQPETLWAEATVLDLVPDLVQRADEGAELAGLQAGDAIHLATAPSPEEPSLLFAPRDGDLRRAAGELGLAVAP